MACRGKQLQNHSIVMFSYLNFCGVSLLYLTLPKKELNKHTTIFEVNLGHKGTCKICLY